jgi:hypothetical protein
MEAGRTVYLSRCHCIITKRDIDEYDNNELVTESKASLTSQEMSRESRPVGTVLPDSWRAYNKPNYFPFTGTDDLDATRTFNRAAIFAAYRESHNIADQRLCECHNRRAYFWCHSVPISYNEWSISADT